MLLVLEQKNYHYNAFLQIEVLQVGIKAATQGPSGLK
jgi:hypothetical protein